jgi:hypothetical protein
MAFFKYPMGKCKIFDDNELNIDIINSKKHYIIDVDITPIKTKYRLHPYRNEKIL